MNSGIRHTPSEEHRNAMFAVATTLIESCRLSAICTLPQAPLMNELDLTASALASAISNLLATEKVRALSPEAWAFSLGVGLGEHLRRQSFADLAAVSNAIGQGMSAALSTDPQPTAGLQ